MVVEVVDFEPDTSGQGTDDLSADFLSAEDVLEIGVG